MSILSGIVRASDLFQHDLALALDLLCVEARVAEGVRQHVEPDPQRFIIEIPNVDLSALPGELSIGRNGLVKAVITALPSEDGRSPEGALRCPICSGELRPAVFLEPVRSDACLQGD